jgi:hypothetical protein
MSAIADVRNADVIFFHDFGNFFCGIEIYLPKTQILIKKRNLD